MRSLLAFIITVVIYI